MVPCGLLVALVSSFGSGWFLEAWCLVWVSVWGVVGWRIVFLAGDAQRVGAVLVGGVSACGELSWLFVFIGRVVAGDGFVGIGSVCVVGVHYGYWRRWDEIGG